MSAKVKSVIVAKAKELNGMVEKPDTATLSLSEIEAQMDVVCDIARRVGIDAEAKDDGSGAYLVFIGGKAVVA